MPNIDRAGDELEGAHGSRKKKGLDVPVYVDGKAVAVLRYGELPAALDPKSMPHRTGARYYGLRDYLSALGVSADRVRAVHLRGNQNRIASVEGDELAREPNRFVFDFMERTGGIARLRWDTTGLRNTFRVEEIRALFVYVERSAPELAPQRSCYLDGNACSDKVPYAEEEPSKGTRIYVDGKLVANVKRRRLGDDLVVGKSESGQSLFDLGKLLAQHDIDLATTRAIELVSGDEIVGRARGEALGDRAAFVVPPHQHGRVRVAVPKSWAAPDDGNVTDTEVTAVLVYRATQPKDRSLTPLSDVPPPEETLLAGGGS